MLNSLGAVVRCRAVRLTTLACLPSLWWPAAVSAAPPTQQQLDQARVAGLAWLVSQQRRDGAWSFGSAASPIATSAGVDAMFNAGLRGGFPYASASAYLSNAQPPSVDGIARQVLTLRAQGTDVSAHVNRLNQAQNGNAAWGSYRGWGSSLPDTPLAISALIRANAVNTSTISNSLCQGLLPAQRPDGSFAYATSASGVARGAGALIPTAYAATALNQVRTALGFSTFNCPTAYSLPVVVSSAVAWMLGKQSTTDGGFGGDGASTVFDTAVAHLALKQINSSTHATALGEAQRYLVAQQRPDGSWGGDALTTALALQALPTLSAGALADANNNGVPDAVEVFLGRSPTAPDRTVAQGNGQSASGTTTSQLLATATQYQPFSLQLTAGGASPTGWRLVSGYLPDGVGLNFSTGLLSGVAQQAGTFNFLYEVVDGNTVRSSVAAQIDVIASAQDADVPLPAWALLLLAALVTAALRGARSHPAGA
jgi:hypothetical protein